jgi:signal transduction histidine kinase
MRRLRLRWQLAASHAVLAIVLVAIAGNRIGAQAVRADRDHATAIAERDADVLAARSSRMVSDVDLLQEVLTDEQQGSRRAEFVSIDSAVKVGSDLAGSGPGATAAARVLTGGSPTIVQASADDVIAASPVVVDSSLVGVALVAETVASHASWLGVFGRSGWIGGLVVIMAGLAGWFLAGVWSRPISALTDDVRGIALGSPITASTRGAIPEVDTLAAAIDGIAGRERRRVDLDAEHATSLRMLARQLSHQLRTPLTVLRLRLDDLSDPELPPEDRDVLTAVVGDQIDQLDRLGEQLAGLDPTRWELDRRHVDVGAVVADVVRRNRPLARWGAVTLALEDPSAAAEATAWADPGVLDEAVANVIQNAIKYTPRGGRIDVSVQRARSEVVVTVSDTGPGIAAHEREHVLRSGGRGAASSIAPGTGHGLSVVTDAAQRHGGRVELADTPGGGATVRIVLPCGDDGRRG